MRSVRVRKLRRHTTGRVRLELGTISEAVRLELPKHEAHLLLNSSWLDFGSSTAESVTARLLLQLHAPTALCPVPACQGMPCGGLVWHSGHNLLFLALNSVQQPSVLWRV